ncbi:MAG TPA: PIN domain nuclease [Anaerolineaceae bacterium]|nr:PIN domain nuclease [Anaerolineaceae bacterium]
MTIDTIFRIIGMLGLGIGGIYLGQYIGQLVSVDPQSANPSASQLSFLVAFIGAVVGLVVTPYLTTKPLRALRSHLGRTAAPTLLAALLGLIMGLIVAALLAFPLSLLPDPFGRILPFLGALLFGYLGISLFVLRQSDIFSVFSGIRGGKSASKDAALTGKTDEPKNILLDTSVIIDGRIADIARTGFLPGSLLIPRFVLNELQYIADSPDSMRRQRGRRGMEVISSLQKEPGIPVTISDIDVEGTREVDEKLVVLARQMQCPILTNDYNLNRVAELQGVKILNVNELANAVKSVLIPGEVMDIQVIQEGREYGQGVAYLDDGTMVVVENGREYLDKQIQVVVTKVLQTAAGRMIFAKPDENIQ